MQPKLTKVTSLAFSIYLSLSLFYASHYVCMCVWVSSMQFTYPILILISIPIWGGSCTVGREALVSI
ncbi:hypothetical protein F4810DRAFT_667747, partial [Camillea tinctor]